MTTVAWFTVVDGVVWALQENSPLLTLSIILTSQKADSDYNEDYDENDEKSSAD